MHQDTPIRKPFLSVVEIAVVFVCIGVTSQAVSFGLGFSGFWTVVPFAILSAGLAVRALIRSRFGHAIVFGLIAILIAAINLPTVPKMFPLRHNVQPALFNDATVAEVLHHIAKSNDDRPYWRFHVSDQQLAYTRINIAIPANASLGQTLDSLMIQTGASYSWNWHKFCGNELSPLCASFYLTRDVSRDRYDNELLIDRHEIFDGAAMDAERGRTKR